MKVDLHTQIGSFPDSSSGNSNILTTTVDQMVEYCNKHQLTHNVCLYPRDGYHLLETLASLTPGTQHYGLQVLMGFKESPSSLQSLKLDILNPDKPLCKGVKIASHKGWWWGVDPKAFLPVPVSGFDYSNREFYKYVLDLLPENAIIAAHTQGDNTLNNSRPLAVGRWAQIYPKLKFIICHSGAYNASHRGNKPKYYVKVRKSGSIDMAMSNLIWCSVRGAISSAVALADGHHNIWLESSAWSDTKLELLDKCQSWGIGSDYPFMEKGFDFTKEVKKAVAYYGEERVLRQHIKTAEFLHLNWQTLVRNHLLINGYSDDIEEAINRLYVK